MHMHIRYMIDMISYIPVSVHEQKSEFFFSPNGLDIFTFLDLPIFQPAADRNVKVLWIVVVGDGKK